LYYLIVLIYNVKSYTVKTENGNPDLLKTTQAVTELCSALVKDPPSGYHVYTDRYYTSPQLGYEPLGMNMVTIGTIMPSRKEMSETVKKEQNWEDETKGCAVIQEECRTSSSLEGQTHSHDFQYFSFWEQK
jgi:hypothetical protein